MDSYSVSLRIIYPHHFFPVTQDTPLATLSTNKISNLQLQLHGVGMDVMAMKSFVFEQFLLIKRNEKLVNEQFISDSENNSELKKSILNQIEYLRRENFIKSNII